MLLLVPCTKGHFKNTRRQRSIVKINVHYFMTKMLLGLLNACFREISKSRTYLRITVLLTLPHVTFLQLRQNIAAWFHVSSKASVISETYNTYLPR